MRWRTEGIGLEDLVPVPRKQPGRHFSAGYHMLGNLARSYDVKYAQMTYGDHYRKKIEDDIIRERNRLDEIMATTKQQAGHNQSMSGSKSLVNKRYNLNEMRHHQRRCAALLFGARQQGEHQVPYLVRWAPRRRESYYLMSERVYNDRLLMKLKEQEEEEKRKMLESPLIFDFDDKFGTTSHLYDFQNLISKTSKNIKGLSFDTQYKDYNYEFKEGEKPEYNEPQGRVIMTPTNDDDTSYSKTSKESKVKFGDVTELESEQTMGRLNRERRRAARAARKLEGLDLNDIDIDFSPDALDDLLGEDGNENVYGGGEGRNNGNLSGDKSFERSRRTRERRKKASSKSGYEGSQVLSDNDASYSSDWTGDEDELENHEMDDGIAELGGVHKNKYCKHLPTSSLKKRSEEYYKKLPRLLKTSELRKKVAESGKVKKPQHNVGPYVNHDCMLPYKTAYERALELVRGRSLPQTPAELYNRTTRMTFSYMPGMPGTEGFSFDTKSGEKKHVSTKTPKGPQGMKGILGDVDMNHFYREEDELIYYVKSEELNIVVESSEDSTESRSYFDSDDDTHDVSEAVTRSTSEAYTLKSKTSFDTDTESVQ